MKDYLPLVVSVVLGGGFIGAIVALLKLRPEAGQITVTAAQGAVIVQTGVIDNLRVELGRCHERISLLERAEAEREQRIDALEDERDQLQDRVQHLETENASLRDELQVIRGNH